MKKDYRKPQIEVVEVELEGAILQASGGTSVTGNDDGANDAGYDNAW